MYIIQRPPATGGAACSWAPHGWQGPQGLARNPPLDGTLTDDTPNYPAPGRYTLATNCLKDPDLAFIVEHPTIVGAAAELLEDDPVLTAYVIYDRTPGGPGLPAHNDYKRWRPVGSSMNWLFTIVPFGNFDEPSGQLFIAPGSHQPERVRDGGAGALEVRPPKRPADDQFIDPGLPFRRWLRLLGIPLV